MLDGITNPTVMNLSNLWKTVGEGNGTPLQYSCLEDPMEGGAWKAAVHGVAEGRTRLSDFNFTFHFHFSLSCIGVGNGNPLQCSCLENQPCDSVQFSSVAQSCLTLCNPMNRSTPGLPVHHQPPEFTQTHIHRVGDAIQPSHPLSSPSPPAPSPSQHQSLFQ